MKLSITHQDSYSRGELILRTLFGFLYIAIPHFFLLIFVGIWSGILSFVTFWVVLFTGKFPQSIFEFQVKLMNWNLRVNAVLSNLVDGYPAFGVKGTSDKAQVEVEYPQQVSRGLVILRALFGWIYVAIPQRFCLVFRVLWGAVLQFLAWWVVLFTGQYPEKWHAYQVGSQRWGMRIGLYLGYFTDEYPPFSGKE
jgi:hypothetical protein